MKIKGIDLTHYQNKKGWGKQTPTTGCDSFSSVQFSLSVMSDSLQPHGLQHPRLRCPSPTPEACSNSCPFLNPPWTPGSSQLREKKSVLCVFWFMNPLLDIHIRGRVGAGGGKIHYITYFIEKKQTNKEKVSKLGVFLKMCSQALRLCFHV